MTNCHDDDNDDNGNSPQGGGLSRSEDIFLDWRHHLSFWPCVFQSTARRDFRGLMVNKCGKMITIELWILLVLIMWLSRSLATYLFLFIAELADLSNSSFTLLPSGSSYQRCVYRYKIIGVWYHKHCNDYSLTDVYHNKPPSVYRQKKLKNVKFKRL